MRTTGVFGGRMMGLAGVVAMLLAGTSLANAQPRYVAQAGQTPAEPYDGWGNAASNIQIAVSGKKRKQPTSTGAGCSGHSRKDEWVTIGVDGLGDIKAKDKGWDVSFPNLFPDLSP